MSNRIGPARVRRIGALIFTACLIVSSAAAQTARGAVGSVAVEPLQGEPPAKIIVDPPLPGPLADGRVVIQFHAENLHILPVFGATALGVSPRVGHVHVTVDGGPFGWAAASGEPVILDGLPPGPHKVLIELVNSNHRTLDLGAVSVTVPKSVRTETVAERLAETEPPARIIVSPPADEPLSRGVVFIPYRTENLRIQPVFGSAGLAVSPRVGHIEVTVDDALWQWEDASGVPVIIQGLSAGEHSILIQLMNANHQSIDQKLVQVTVPAVHSHGAER